jgi:predicted protein tyrosine phosphatase
VSVESAPAVRERWEPNFTWIVPGLAIGGSFPMERVADLSAHHRVGAVVDLRAEARDDDCALRRHGIDFLHLPTEDHGAVTQEGLARGVAFADDQLDRDRRVLIHCEHGIGRSATLALCVMVNRGMAPLEALERAKAQRPLVSPSPAQYHAWIGWLASWRRATGADVELPTFDAFKAIAYRHLENP